MNSQTGTTAMHDIVPKSAQAGAVVILLLAMASGFGAILLLIALGVGMVASIVIDPGEHLAAAFWCFMSLASLTLHVPGEHRRVIAAALAVLVPGGFIWLIAAHEEAGGGLFFIALIMHALVAMTIALSEHAARLDSPKYWFAKRVGAGVCPRCLYDIRNLPSLRCPECGLDFSESPGE